MSNTWDLQRLQDKREEILKAELFMLLHDVGKLHSGHQTRYLRNDRGCYLHTKFGPPASRKFLEQFTRFLHVDLHITVQGQSVSLREIIECHHLRQKLPKLIGLAKKIDSLDSQWDRNNVFEKKVDGRKMSPIVGPLLEHFGVYTAFGWEKTYYADREIVTKIRNTSVRCDPPRDTLERFLCTLNYLLHKQMPPDKHEFIFGFISEAKSRRNVYKAISLFFSKASGDSRFSVNEISLWEHSVSTGILYKLSICKSFLDQAIVSKMPSVQLLPLRIDGLTYLAQSNNIPDLLARRARLQKVYDTWQDILEWEFPLAGEVYRDENGPVFLTFLGDKDGKNAISNLKLPHDPLLPDAYMCSVTLNEYLYKTIVYLTQGDLTLPKKLELITYTQERSQEKQEKQKKSLGDLLREEYKKGLWLQADAQCLELNIHGKK